MLRELRINNFTIVDDLSINFESGLNILTGETGAGKSIVVDAIGMLLGGKASQDMIKTGERDARIEAHFDDTGHPLLRELSIGSDEGIILRRNVSSYGKGRSYINDTSSSIQTLSAVGSSLVDIHGQHEHQGLLKKESHLQFLDSFGGLAETATSFHSDYQKVSDIKKRVSGMRDRIRERSQKIEFLRFQIGEIDSANLKHGEKESAEEERAILLNLSKLKESSETAYSLLYNAEGSSVEKLAAAAARIRDIVRIDNEAQELLTMLESAVPLLEDSAAALRKLKEKYELDPGRLDSIEERLDLLKRLEKKYGSSAGEILKYREKAFEELKGLEHIDEQLDSLETELKEKENSLLSAAETISEKRLSAAKKMEALVVSELRELGFQKAEFKIDMRRKESISPNGIDDVEFLFSANPGEPPKPMSKVASGGELSRIMLALKCIEISQKTEDRNTPPNPPLGKGGRGGVSITASKTRTLIFDEVDAGIGGVTARQVAKRLKDISKDYQVLCISHLPQIAALADNHMRVEKIVSKDNVKVRIEPLTGRKREEELARMLSGKITDSSLKHAKELLGK